MNSFNRIVTYEIEDGRDEYYNFSNAKVTFEDGNVIECSAQTFGDMLEANQYHSRLVELKSAHILTAIGVAESKRRGIVFVERIKSFGTWLSGTNKKGMWRMGLGGKCLGVGVEFKKIFQQILLGLKCLHEANLSHNNLKQGVYLGSDHKIRLGNFYNADNITIKSDFTDFKELVEVAVRAQPPIGISACDIFPPEEEEKKKKFKSKVPEVTLFQDLFEAAVVQAYFEDLTQFLYYPSILWGPVTKSIFYVRLSAIMQTDSARSVACFPLTDFYDNQWLNQIPVSSPLYTTAYFEINRGKPLNSWYRSTNGIVVLIRNRLGHHDFDAIVFDEVDAIFPEALGGCFYDLVFGYYLLDLLTSNEDKKKKFAHGITVANYLWADGLLTLMEYSK